MVISRERLKREGESGSVGATEPGEEGFASYGEPKGGGQHTPFESNFGQGSTGPKETTFYLTLTLPFVMLAYALGFPGSSWSLTLFG